VREQGFDRGEGLGAGQHGEDVPEVGVGLEVAGLGRLDQAVEVRAGLRASDRVGREPVLPSDDARTDRDLDELRVQRDATVVENRLQLLPLACEIGQRLPRETLRRDQPTCTIPGCDPIAA
jgi:hypothetical protein